MKRLCGFNRVSFLKHANHDINERTEAVLYINGEIYMGLSHNECINLYERDNGSKQHGGKNKRPDDDQLEQLADTLGFGHLVTYDDFCDQVPYDISEFEEDVWNELCSNWNPGEVRVFIEVDNLFGVSCQEMISACNEQIPRDFDYYNLTYWNDEMVEEKQFSTISGDIISVPMYKKI